MDDLTTADYRALSSFRSQIRRFLHFSEEAARAEGLEPQQHQMLLAIRARNQGASVLIGELAEALMIRHHSAVGLVDRLVERGLVLRTRASIDRRQVGISLTPLGEAKLKRLSGLHRSELANTAPLLVSALQELIRHPRKSQREGDAFQLEDSNAPDNRDG